MNEMSVWQTVLGEIELQVSKAIYATWFKNAQLLEYKQGKALVSVPNIFTKQQLEVKYNHFLLETFKKQGVDILSIEYIISSGSRKPRESRSSIADSMPEISRPIPQETRRPVSTSGLNEKYTFDSFIVGSSNELAFAACQSAARNPGTKCNPLFIYGGVGLGKTHLIQAVGNEIVKKNPSAKILYISSEAFVNDFLDTIRFRKKGFADRYRNVDVLIVDDMQFIAGKEKTQEEFFHTFNALHQANKQIIISSDKPPKSIPTLTERLRSRFEWGMTADMQLPDFETRCAILTSKAASNGISLDAETVEYIATNVQTNIRELEGALNKVLTYCEMSGMEPDAQVAAGLIGDIKQSRPHHVTAKQIIERTAKHFQLDTTEVTSARRDKHIVVPRQIAMYLLRSELHLSFPRIAAELGRKDHTTAIHSVEKIEKALKLDFMIREQVTTIRERLYG
jgi:chromosomal replication initiator protein